MEAARLRGVCPLFTSMHLLYTTVTLSGQPRPLGERRGPDGRGRKKDGEHKRRLHLPRACARCADEARPDGACGTRIKGCGGGRRGRTRRVAVVANVAMGETTVTACVGTDNESNGTEALRCA